MKVNRKIWIGIDPGGKGKFGVAVLEDGGQQTATVNYADQAVEVVIEILNGRIPSGIGVDAPLWWSSGLSGDRQADQSLREAYGSAGVLAINSLRGAALIQGVMFVQRMSDILPSVPVTESHPKVLLNGLHQGNWDAFANEYGLNPEVNNEHERDALIAAISAREGFEDRWEYDLSLDRFDCEQDPAAHWIGPVHYFWPEGI